MPVHRSRLPALVSLAICCGLPALPASADPGHFRAHYDASIFGLTLGSGDFTSSIDGDDFSVSGTFASVGLARLFDKTDGHASVSGTMAAEATRPQSYKLAYKSGEERQKTTIAFAGGRVTDTTNVPPPKKRGSDWVPVSHADLAGVADPLSALMIPTDKPGDVCNRTIKVYDGEIRVNLVLREADDSEKLESGEVTCRVGFMPVSGYRKTRSALKYLRDKAKILVAFAPIGDTGIQSPVEATIGTEVGTVHIRARPAEVK